MSDISIQAQARINEFIGDIGAITGQQHPTLNDGIQTLIDGYGQGEDSLPDWDDDSPIIASGHGYGGQTCNIWEFTEKGTLRWRYDPNGTCKSGAYRYAAGWGNTVAIHLMHEDFLAVANKIKQLDIAEEYTKIYLGYMVNLKRIRIKGETIAECTLSECFCLEQIECIKTDNLVLGNSRVIEKFELSPTHTYLKSNFASSAYCLKEINLENVTNYGQSCFSGCVALKKDIVFNKNLTYISNTVFRHSAIKTATFQNSLDSLPTISNNAFQECEKLTDIYVPWAEGAVANAPWGATSATIHYNSEV